MLDEGKVRKGGKGKKPLTPPPSGPPGGQRPKPQKEEVILDDSGAAYPEPFFYMVNSMASEQDLKIMAEEFAKRVKGMPKGLTVRDWLVGQALFRSADFVSHHAEPNGDGWNRWWVDKQAVKNYVDAAEALADEYLSRRKKKENNDA